MKRRPTMRFVAAMTVCLIFIISTLLATDAVPVPIDAAPIPHAGRYAVIIVIDGARYDEVNLAQMPNLAALAARGAVFTEATVGQLPSITETSHATIGTGVWPARHGILGDTWRIPGTNTLMPNLLSSQLIESGYMGRFIQQRHVPSIAAIIHHRYPGSVVVALSGHKSYAAAGMGAATADYVAFGMRDKRDHFVPFATLGHAPARSIMESRRLDLPSYPRKMGLENSWAITLAEKFLFKYHPRLMMINLPETDNVGHRVGTDPAVMGPLMVDVDRQIGRLVAAYKRAGLLSQTTFVVTADHGMVPALHTVDTTLLFKIIRGAGGDPLRVGHGDDSTIWLKNRAAIPQVATALAQANIPNVDAVYMRNAHGHYVLISPVSRLADPAARHAYAHLLSTFDNRSAPGIVLFFDENTIVMTDDFRKSGRKGDHEGATWGAQHIPLIVAGPGIKAGYQSSYPAYLVDLAPTVETLLGARPSHQDGNPLADAMVQPPPWAAQDENKKMAQRVVAVGALQQEATLRPNQ